MLARTGVAIPYPTLHRLAVQVLQFGRPASTIPIAGEARPSRHRRDGAALQGDSPRGVAMTARVGWRAAG